MSSIVGVKVSRKHPKMMRVLVYRERETKRYDFECASHAEAETIVGDIRVGLAEYGDPSQRKKSHADRFVPVPFMVYPNPPPRVKVRQLVPAFSLFSRRGREFFFHVLARQMRRRSRTPSVGYASKVG
nr:hypothetical protein CFP56_69454 [Quercus suber]